MYKFLNEPSRELDNFNSLLKIVRELFPDREFELMNNYLRTVDPNKKTARVGLEYANMSRIDDLYEHLIEKLLDSSNAESKEWSQLYHLYQQGIKGSLPQLEIVDKVNEMRIKTPEMKVYSKLIIIYSYYHLGLFDILKQTSKLVDHQIVNIKDEFIKDSFTSRYGLVMTTVSLHSGSIEGVRTYGEMTLQSCQRSVINCQVLLQMGNSYMFESYEKSMEYFHKALSICNVSNKEEQIKNSMNFVNNYWGKNPDFLDYSSDTVSDKHEVAFHYIQSGRQDEGINLLNELNFEELTHGQKGFNLFYKGLATGNKNFYYESVRHFNLAGEKFYKKLPLIELRKLGENEIILDALSV